MITKYSDLKNKFKSLKSNQSYIISKGMENEDIKRKYLESIQLIIKGIKLAEELNDLELLIILKKKLASIYISIERYKEAIEVLEQIKQLKVNLNILDANKNYKVLYEQNKLIYEKEKKNISKVREKIGMVFQSYDLFPNMTILNNLLLAPMKVQKRNKEEVKKEAEQLLDRVGLLDKKDNYPRQLSGGQKQRVAIVRAMLMHPEIMLLDEITAPLHPQMVRAVPPEVLLFPSQDQGLR